MPASVDRLPDCSAVDRLESCSSKPNTKSAELRKSMKRTSKCCDFKNQQKVFSTAAIEQYETILDVFSDGEQRIVKKGNAIEEKLNKVLAKLGST